MHTASTRTLGIVTAPSPRERECFKIFQRYRKARICQQWGGHWPGRIEAALSTMFERVPPAPVNKSIGALLSAYSGSLAIKQSSPELLVELVTVLYGAGVARDLNIPEMISASNKEVWATKTRAFADGVSINLVSTKERVIKQLNAMLPQYAA